MWQSVIQGVFYLHPPPKKYKKAVSRLGLGGWGQLDTLPFSENVYLPAVKKTPGGATCISDAVCSYIDN